MNIDTNKPNVQTLGDRQSYWRQVLENARKLGDVELATTAKDRLKAINDEAIAKNVRIDIDPQFSEG